MKQNHYFETNKTNLKLHKKYYSKRSAQVYRNMRLNIIERLRLSSYLYANISTECFGRCRHGKFKLKVHTGGSHPLLRGFSGEGHLYFNCLPTV